MPSKCFIIGNGTSREGVDLEKFRAHGITIGCNRLYTEFEPDFLITLDKDVVDEIQELIDYDWPRRWRWVHREVLDIGGHRMWVTVDGAPVCYLSRLNGGYNNQGGLIAACFAAEIIGADEIYLIGIDFFQPVPGRGRNLHYGEQRLSPPHQWSWNRLVENNKNSTFYRVGPIAEYDRDFYDNKLQGMVYISYDKLDRRLNGRGTD